MDKTVQLRRQAEFCLRLSHMCSDEPVSQHLNALAARYHEAALRAEFNVPDDEAHDRDVGGRLPLTVPNFH